MQSSFDINFLNILSVSNNASSKTTCGSVRKVAQANGSQKEEEVFETQNTLSIKEVPLPVILTRNISSNFSPEFLSICEYTSQKKTACYRPFKN